MPSVRVIEGSVPGVVVATDLRSVAADRSRSVREYRRVTCRPVLGELHRIHQLTSSVAEPHH